MKALSSKLLSGKRVHGPSPTSSFISSSHQTAASTTSRGHTADFNHVGGGNCRLATPISRVDFSHAGLQAHDPCQDLYVQVVDSRHAFAAVLSSKHASQAASYLQRHLHKEMVRQLKMHHEDVPQTLRAAVTALDQGFRHLHPFNSSILDSVDMATLWLDFATRTAYMGSKGQCQIVIGSTDEDGSVQVVAQTELQSWQEPASGKENQKGRQQQKPIAHEEVFLQSLRAIALEESVDTVLVGSSGFWREVYPEKALLRLRHYFDETPEANGGVAAAHLILLAMDTVVKRMQRQRDPRMAALRSVASLQSLHVGDISNYKWGGRQPLRRRRGDVHGDMTLLVLRLDWSQNGGSGTVTPTGSVKAVAKRLRQSLSNSKLLNLAHSDPPRERALRNWDLLRMHFVDYARDARRRVRQRWFQVVDAALLQAHDEQHRLAAAAALLVSGDHGPLAQVLPKKNRSRPGSFFAALEAGQLSRWRRGTSSAGLSSTSLRSGTSTASSTIGADSDAESPTWRPHGPLADVAEPATPPISDAFAAAHVSAPPSPIRTPPLSSVDAPALKEREGEDDDIEVELRSLRHRAPVSHAGGVGRTVTYRSISLDRVWAAPSAA